jgi:hypothetical protein
MNKKELCEEVAKLKPEPGDLIVAKVPENMTTAQIQNFVSTLGKILSSKVQGIVIKKNMDIELIKKKPLENIINEINSVGDFVIYEIYYRKAGWCFCIYDPDSYEPVYKSKKVGSVEFKNQLINWRDGLSMIGGYHSTIRKAAIGTLKALKEMVKNRRKDNK